VDHNTNKFIIKEKTPAKKANKKEEKKLEVKEEE